MANTKIPDLTLSDTLNTQRLKFNQLLDSVGDVSALTTAAGPVSDAINELDAELGTISAGAMGTTASTVSGAIAELDGRLDSINNTQLTSPEIRITGSSVSSVAGKLEVGDSADFASNMSVQGNLAVGGNTTMSGTLTVDGQVTFKAGSDNNIALGDAATDTITLTGEVNSNVVPDADNTYDLGTASKEWRHVYVDGTVNADNVAADSATITGDLDVQGITTLDSTAIDGNLILSTDKFTVDYTGNTSIAGTLNVDGVTTTDSINAVGLVAITGDLTVSDSARVDGNMSIGGGFNVAGDTTFANTITVQDSAYVTGNLDVGGSLDVAIAATLASAKVSDLTSGRVTIAGTDGELGDDSKFTWDTTNGLKITEALTVEDSAYITGNLNVGSALSAGTTTLGSTTLSSAKVSDLTNDRLVVVGTDGELEDDGNLTWNGTLLDVTGGLSVSQGFTVGGTFTTTGVTRNAASYVIVNDQVSVANGNRAGLAVDRPSTDSAVIQWNELGDYWEAGTTAGVKRLALQNDSAAFEDVYVAGNLTVSGTTTTINSTAVEIGDRIIELNSGLADNAGPTQDAGIEIERGNRNNAQLVWDESENYWAAHDDSAATKAGTLSRIATSSWLDATAPISYNSSTGNFSHDNATRTNIATSEAVAHSGSFDVVDSIQSNATGHVTQVATRTITLPAGAVPNNATITISGGTDLETGGDFTTDQSSTETITIDHSDITRTNVSTAESPGYGGSFDVVDSIQSNARGHITNVATRTITLPASDNTNTTYSAATSSTLGLSKLGNNTAVTGTEQSVTTTAGRFYKVQHNSSDQLVVNVPWVDTNTDTDTTYSAATSSYLGLSKLGSNTEVTATEQSVTTTAGRFYKVQHNASDQLVVNVPWVDTNTDTNTTYSAGKDLDLNSGTFDIEATLNYVTAITTANNTDFTLTTSGSGDISLVSSSDIVFDNPTYADSENITFLMRDNLNGGSVIKSGHLHLASTNSTQYYQASSEKACTQSGTHKFQTGNCLNASLNIICDAPSSITTLNANNALIINSSSSSDIEIVAASNLELRASNDVYIKPTGDNVFMQGNTSGEQIEFTLGTGSQTILASDDLNVGATGGDLTLYTTTSGDVDLNPASGKIGLWDNGTERAGFDVNSASTLKIYTGSNFGTLNSTFSSDDLTVQGDITSVSDVRTKENIETVENGLDLVSQLRGVWYNKIGKDERKVGVIAQEVEEILPEVVHTDAEGMKAVDYGKMVGVLIEAIKDLKAEIEELKAQ